MFSANSADIFYRGAVVFIDTAGGVQCLPEKGDRALGVIPYQQTTTAAGDEIEVIVQGNIWMPLGAGPIAVTDEGDILIVDEGTTLSDNVDDMPSAIVTTLEADDIAVGRIMRVKSDKMLIGISPALTGSIATAANVLQFD